MNYSTIKYEKRNGIGYVVLNRPEAANALNLQMAMELKEVCSLLNQDEELRVAIVTGAGDKDFCSGEDLGEFGGRPSKEFIRNCDVAEVILKTRLPTIAAINGNALGIGLALTLGCDFRVVSEGALLGVPETGYLLPTGITQFLPRVVGRGKAMEMVLLAELVDAQEAYRTGLVHKVVPYQEVTVEAERIAGRIASRAPIALKCAKEAVHKGLDLTLEQGLRLECDLYMILQTTADRTEGIKAFLEKRTPQFRGR
jgi:enoyl-CoA hydratase